MSRIPALRTALARVVRMALFPALLYFVLFCLVTYPLVLSFPTHLFGDEGDAVQNAWNLWWVDKAVTQLGQSPWYTTHQYYPYGVSLVSHALSPLNGFSAIPLLRLMPVFQVYNLLLVLSFVLGGLTAFWLACEFSRSYAASLAAGYLYAFSGYHFTHAAGHLELVTIQWIPLFALFFYRLLRRPRPSSAIAAGLTLFAVSLVTYYHLLYCALIMLVMLAWYTVAERRLLWPFGAQHRGPLLAFALVTLATTGPLAYMILRLNAVDPVTGGHPAQENSLDVQALVIPGAHWRFGELTRPYWSTWRGNINENGVGLGLSITLLVAGAWLLARRAGRDLWLWSSVLVVFGILSLGPVLHAGGAPLTPPGLLPYAWLEAALPELKASGMPVRMMIVALLGATVVSAIGLPYLWRRSAVSRALAVLLLAGAAVESLPGPVPQSAIPVPEYVRLLATLPGDGAVLYTNYLHFRSGAYPLYFQMINDKPIGYGSLARLPQSTRLQTEQLRGVLRTNDCGNNLGVLNEKYGFRYLVVPAFVVYPGERLLYDDGRAALYDLDAARGARTLALKEDLQPLGSAPAEELLPGRPLGYAFTATRGGLSGVGVFMTTYARSLRGPLTFHLEDASGADVVTLHGDLAAVRDNAWTSFTFAPLPGSAGQAYYAWVEAPEARAGQTAGVGVGAPGEMAVFVCYR